MSNDISYKHQVKQLDVKRRNYKQIQNEKDAILDLKQTGGHFDETYDEYVQQNDSILNNSNFTAGDSYGFDEVDKIDDGPEL